MERLKHVLSFVGFIAVTAVTAAALPTNVSAVLPGIPQRVEQLEAETSNLNYRVEDLELTARPQTPPIHALSSDYVKIYVNVIQEIHASSGPYIAGVAPAFVVKVKSCDWNYPPDSGFWPYCPVQEPTEETATLSVLVTPDNMGPHTFDSGPEFETLAELVTNGVNGHVNFWDSVYGYTGSGGTSRREAVLFEDYIAPGEKDLKDRYTLHSVRFVFDQFSEDTEGIYHLIGRVIFRLEPLPQ
jgi:hypothetical protein